jgi:CRP-like cAMP-binding protein
MQNDDIAPGYQIWGADHAAYGPVELPTLVKWVKDERVIADTWVFEEETNTWSKASQIPELKMFFKPKVEPAEEVEEGEPEQRNPEIKPDCLRRIKIFAGLDDDQLNAFLKYIEAVRVGPFKHVIQRGDPGEAMYLVLQGELRSCILIDGKECPVANLTPGSIFGEVSMLDRGPHAADVMSNSECVLMKITADAFEKVIQEAPQPTLAFLLALSRSLAGRARTLTKRYEDSVHLSQTAEVGQFA